MLGGDYQFKLQCPLGYPDYSEHFYIPEADPVIKLWANAINEFLLDSPQKVTLTQILNKAVSVHWNDHDQKSQSNSEDERSMDEDDEQEEEIPALAQDDFFTTEWELNVARKKKRWAMKEQEIREKMKKVKVGPSVSDFSSIQVTGQEKDQAKQIFTSCAASGILTNDLLKILECDKILGFTADPMDDNIYQWCVHLFNFLPGSDLDLDLMAMHDKFGYNWIELQLVNTSLSIYCLSTSSLFYIIIISSTA
jgi:baculoviral IAP repeat-containing protein 6